MINQTLRHVLLGTASSLASVILFQGCAAYAQEARSSILIDQTVQQASSWSGAFADPPPPVPVPGNTYNSQPIGYEFWPVTSLSSNVLQSSGVQVGNGSSSSAVQQNAENQFNSATVALGASANVVRQGIQNNLSPSDYQTITQFLTSAPQNIMSATNMGSAGYTNQVDPFNTPSVVSEPQSLVSTVTGSGSGQAALNSVNSLNAAMTSTTNTSLTLQQTNRTASSSGLFDTVQRSTNSADAAVYNTQAPVAGANVHTLNQTSMTTANSASLSGNGALVLSGEQSNVFDTTAASEYKTQQQIGNVATAVTLGDTPSSFAPGLYYTNSTLGSGNSHVESVAQNTMVSTNTLASNLSLAIAAGASFDQTFSDRAIETSVAQTNAGGLVTGQNAKNVLSALTGAGSSSISGSLTSSRQDAVFAANAVSTSGQLDGTLRQNGVIINSSAAGSSENIALAHSETGPSSILNLQQRGDLSLNTTRASAISNSSLQQNSVTSITTANDMYANSNVASAQYLGAPSGAAIGNSMQTLQAISNVVSANSVSGSSVSQNNTTDPGAGFSGISLANNMGVTAGSSATATAQNVSQNLNSTVNMIAAPLVNYNSSQSFVNGTQNLSGTMQVNGAAATAFNASQAAVNSANSIRTN